MKTLNIKRSVTDFPNVIKAAAELYKLNLKPGSIGHDRLTDISTATLESAVFHDVAEVRAMALYELALRSAKISNRKYRELMNKANAMTPGFEERAYA